MCITSDHMSMFMVDVPISQLLDTTWKPQGKSALMLRYAGYPISSFQMSQKREYVAASSPPRSCCKGAMRALS